GVEGYERGERPAATDAVEHVRTERRGRFRQAAGDDAKDDMWSVDRAAECRGHRCETHAEREARAISVHVQRPGPRPDQRRIEFLLRTVNGNPWDILFRGSPLGADRKVLPRRQRLLLEREGAVRLNVGVVPLQAAQGAYGAVREGELKSIEIRQRC